MEGIATEAAVPGSYCSLEMLVGVVGVVVFFFARKKTNVKKTPEKFKII